MKRFEINHDSFIQGPLIVKVFSNTIKVPKGVLQAVNDAGKKGNCRVLKGVQESMCIGHSYNNEPLQEETWCKNHLWREGHPKPKLSRCYLAVSKS